MKNSTTVTFYSNFPKEFRLRKKIITAVICMLSIFFTYNVEAQVAGWTFDATPAAPGTPTSVTANLGTQAGTATLYADGTNGSSLWVTSTAGLQLTAFDGSTLNDPRGGGATAGKTYSPVGGTSVNAANGKSMVIKFSMTGLENPILSFATRGTGTGFNTHQWAWSTDNSSYTNFGANTAVTATTFEIKTLDMSAINSLDGAATVYLRITFSGSTNTSGNNRLDNIIITATTIATAPVVTAANLTATFGTPFTYAIVASNSPTSYALESGTLPPGLTLTTGPGAGAGTISGTPTVVGPFTANVTASNAVGQSAPAALNFTINKANQVITGLALTDTKTYGVAPYNLSATGGASGNNVTYASDNTGVATILNNQVTIVGAGSAHITASQAGNGNYNAAPDVVQTLTVNKATQVINFAALDDKNDTDPDFQLTATGGASGNLITYVSSNEAVATISGDMVSILSPGTTLITASQAGNTNYFAATDVSQQQVIINTSLLNQTIIFDPLPAKVYGDASFQLTATGGGSGEPVTYESSDVNVATISGNTVTIVGAGSADITASQAGNSNYNAASDVTQSLLVSKKQLTVTGATADNKPYDGTTAATISGASLAGIEPGDIVTLSGGGTFISANAGTNIAVTAALLIGGLDEPNYTLTQPTGLTADIDKLNQTIIFDPLVAKTFGNPDFTLSATGGASGNAVTFASSDISVATVSGNTVHIVGAGSTTITASQAGNINYNAAADVLQTQLVNKATQTISFAALPNKTTADIPFALTATGGGSGNPVTYQSSNIAVATVTGNTVTITGIGSSDITASQAGNSNYLPANNVVRTQVVTAPLIAAWDFNGQNSGPATVAATIFNNLSSSNLITRGAGAANNGPVNNSFRTVGFQNNGIAVTNTDYFQVTLSAATGKKLSLSGITGKFAGTNTFVAAPGVTSQFAYSLDGNNFTLIGSPVQSTSLTMTPVDLSVVSALQNVPSGTTVTIRYYASGQTATGGWGFTSPTAGDYGLAFSGNVTSSPPTVSFVKTDVSVCGGTNDGTITVTATGTGTLHYSWTGITGSGNPATTPFSAGDFSSLSGLPIGYYNVTVTDGNSNSTTVNGIHIGYAYSVYITNSGSISSSCTNTGSIILYGTAGVPPYSYSLDGSVYATGVGANIFSALAPGNHTANVKDAAGCISTKIINVGVAQPINVNAYARAASSCGNDGSIEIYKTGGIPPFSYSKDGVNYVTGTGSNIFSNLPAGPYTVYVKDSRDCIGQQNLTITQGVALYVTASKSNTSSCVNDGTIQLNASGGTGIYTFSLNGTNYVAGNSFTGLSASNYTGYVKDSKGCIGTVQVTISVNTISVTAYTAPSTDCFSNNGVIQLFRTGGTGPYTYSLDGDIYQNSNLFTALPPGYYSGFVKDSKSCTAQFDDIFIGPVCGKGNSVSRTSSEKMLKISSDKSTAIAYPNPSASEFTLQLLGYRAGKVSITVTDVMGRKLFIAEGDSHQQYRFGGNFKSGIYNVQVTQGDSKKTILVVKQ